MKKMRASYCRIVSNISEWSGRGVSIVLFLLVGVLAYEVTMRYVFNSPTIWGQELSLFLFGTTGMIGGAYVLLHKAHVNLDLLYSRVTRRKQAILDLITAPLFFFIIIAMVWAGGGFALRSWKILEPSSTVWAPPVYPFKTIVPVAAFLLLLQGAAKFIRDLYFATHGRELE